MEDGHGTGFSYRRTNNHYLGIRINLRLGPHREERERDNRNESDGRLDVHRQTEQRYSDIIPRGWRIDLSRMVYARNTLSMNARAVTAGIGESKKSFTFLVTIKSAST